MKSRRPVVVNGGCLGSWVTMLSKLDWWRLYYNQLVPISNTIQKAKQTCHYFHLASRKGPVNAAQFQMSCNAQGRGQDGGYKKCIWKRIMQQMWSILPCYMHVQHWGASSKEACLPFDRKIFSAKVIVSLLSWIQFQWLTGRRCTSGHLGSCRYRDSHIAFHTKISDGCQQCSLLWTWSGVPVWHKDISRQFNKA